MSITSDRVSEILQGWDALGIHRTGTDVDRATATWLADAARAAGAEPQLIAFPFRRRDVKEARAVVGDFEVHGLPAFDGASTGTAGVAARLQSLAAVPDASGGIGVAVVAPNAGASLNRLRQRSRHQALISVTDGSQVRPGLAPFNADAYGKPFGPPVLQVPSDARDKLTVAATAGASARLWIVDEYTATEAVNVEVRVAGRDANAAPLVVMTPRSGWWVCTSERGGGLVVWLEILRYFTAHPPRRPVWFTANTGHELGHSGLDHFVQANPGIGKSAHAWIHLGANFSAAYNGAVRLQCSSEELRTLSLRAMTEYNAPPAVETEQGERPFGEARNVFDAGGQFVSLLGGNGLFHHPDDRWPDAIDLPLTIQLARAFVRIAVQLAA